MSSTNIFSMCKRHVYVCEVQNKNDFLEYLK
jgi:hypothetical protein